MDNGERCGLTVLGGGGSSDEGYGRKVTVERRCEAVKV